MMRHAALVVSLLFTLEAQAKPWTFSYGGQLLDGGKPVDGTVAIELKFYKQASGGTALPVSAVTFNDVALQDGAFQVDAAQLTDAELDLIFKGDTDTYVEVLVNAKPYYRQKIVAVPYALRVPVDGKRAKFDETSGKLTVGPAGNAAAGEFLTTDASGNLAWGTPAAGSTLPANANGYLKNVGGTLSWDTPAGNGDMLAATWSSGGAISLTKGGTGATTITAARVNLGLAIGADVQAFDATLANLAGLTTSADQLVYTTAADSFSTSPLTGFARSVLDDTNQAAMQTTLGVLPGTHVQAYDADLAALAATTTNGFPARTGAGTWEQRSIVAGSGKVVVNNGNGVGGNPSIDVVESSLALSNIGGTLPITKGGTGTTTASGAINALLPSQGSQGGKFLKTDGANVSWSLISSSSIGLASGAAMNIGTSSSHSASIHTANVQRVTVDDTGETGFGTTTPEGMIHVHKASSPTVRLTNSTSGDTAADGGTLSLSSSTLTLANLESGSIEFAGSGSPIAAFDTANARLGIGTISPSFALHVSGSAPSIYSESTSASMPGAILAAHDSGGYAAVYTYGSGGSGSIGGQSVASKSLLTSSGALVLAPQSGDLFLGTGSTPGTTVATISGSNFGIGTTSPSYPLHVTRSGSGPSAVVANTSSNPAILEIQSKETSASPLPRVALKGVKGSGNSDGQLHIETFSGGSPVTRMKIDENGNVGLGVNPTERLDVGSGNVKMGWERASNSSCAFNSDCTITCSGTRRLLGGGCSWTTGPGQIVYSYPSADDVWTCKVSGSGGTVTAWAICANIR